MTVRRIGVLAALLGVALGGCGGATKSGAVRGNAHPIVLRMANQLGEPDVLWPYAREVARLTHGSVRIDIGARAHIGDPAGERMTLADVRSGRSELAWVGSRALDTVGDSRFAALSAPLLIDSYALEQKVLESPLVGGMLDSMRSLGVVGLGVLPGPLRVVLGVSRPITRPADFRGAVVGFQDSALAARTVQALGAIPRPTPGMGGTLTGLDVYEQQLSSIYGNQYFRHARSVTANLVLWPRPMVLFANPTALGRLSPDQRAALHEAATNVIPAYAQSARREQADAIRTLCSIGVPFSRAVLPEFRAAFQPVYAGLRRDPATRSQLAQIEAMKQGVPAEPVAGCSAPVPSIPGAPTVLDGTYRKTLTPAQAHSRVAENWGTFVRVFDHGRFALTQESPRACTWVYGTYTLDGSRIHFVVTDGGGIAPNNAGGKPGERVDLRWNLYRRALTLPSPPGGEPVEFGAYRQISTLPTSRSFSRRCPPPADWDR